MRITGIAGGSGAGKSALSYALVDARPDIFEVIHLDDYHRHHDEPNLPMMHGMINWDHPDIMRWDDLISDIRKLKSGQTITLDTKVHRSNPDYAETRQTIMRTIEPKPVIIIDGYLALYNPDLVKLMDKSFYLDLDETTRMKRRDKHKLIGHTDYNEKVLKPMHHQFVEPTKKVADEVINVSNKSAGQICSYLLSQLI